MFGLTLLPYGWIGALIVSRQPRQPMGWLLCAFGLSSGLAGFANEYAIHGLVTRPGALPGAAAVAWSTFLVAPMILALLAALLVLFPSGRPPSPRWRWVLWLAGVGNGLFAASALWAWPLRGRAILQLKGTPDPVGVLGVLYAVGSMAGLLGVLAAVVSLVVRFRRAKGAERQQIKWLAFAAVLAAGGFPLLVATVTAVGTSELAADILFAALVTPIPLAVGAAIFKYRLYDVDRLINRTLVYALLTALLGAVYAGVVLVLGQGFGGISAEPPSWAVASATLAVAALFQPARRRIQQAVDRRFNRRRYDAARIVEAFRARLRDEVDLDTLSAELLAVVHQTVQPTTASLWLRASTSGPRRSSA